MTSTIPEIPTQRDIESFKEFCEKLGGEIRTDINLGTIVMKCIFRNPLKVRKLYA